MDENTVDTTPVSTDTATPAKVRKPRVSKEKASARTKAKSEAKVLVLPAPTVIGGTKDLNLGKLTERFSTSLVEASTGGKYKNVASITDTVALGTALPLFFQALVNASMNGCGASPDGSAVYVHEHADDVIKMYPNVKSKYFLQMTVEGRGGLSQYLAPVSALLEIARTRAKVIELSQKSGGKIKARTLKSGVATSKASAPTVKL